MLQIKDKIIIGLLLGYVVLIMLLLHTCNTKTEIPVGKPSVKEVIVYRDAPPAKSIEAKVPGKLSVSIPKKKRISAAGDKIEVVDTVLQNLVTERDSLTEKLRDSNVSMSFRADTIHPETKDTLIIICDEIRRNIEYSLHYAPRQEKTIIRTETFIEEVPWWKKLYYATYGLLIAELFHLFVK